MRFKGQFFSDYSLLFFLSSVAIILLCGVLTGVVSNYETVQGTLLSTSWPLHGSGVTVTIGNPEGPAWGNATVTFHDPDEVCALEVGRAYRLKYVTTYHKTHLRSYELLEPIPCPQEASE